MKNNDFLEIINKINKLEKSTKKKNTTSFENRHI